MNMLVDKDNTAQFKDFLEAVEMAIMSKSPTKKINELKSMIEDLEKKKDSILELRISGVVFKKGCGKKYTALSQELEIKKDELNTFKDQRREATECKNRLKKFKDTILQHKTIDVFPRRCLRPRSRR